ncbi:hypothetical protein MRB53_009977 [Persea americana]|uniref:Uncharacterized protein n=1 Tax=Persea americana TaxID=3435 RepID=A0ACC2LQR7_PERAE|nr:hypothetical protein MRB53_009977 [Persea americana]
MDVQWEALWSVDVQREESPCRDGDGALMERIALRRGLPGRWMMDEGDLRRGDGGGKAEMMMGMGVLYREMRSDVLRVMDGKMGTGDWDDGVDEVMIRRETMERCLL